MFAKVIENKEKENEFDWEYLTEDTDYIDAARGMDDNLKRLGRKTANRETLLTVLQELDEFIGPLKSGYTDRIWIIYESIRKYRKGLTRNELTRAVIMRSILGA